MMWRCIMTSSTVSIVRCGEHVHHGLWRTGRETSAEATRNLTDAVVAKARLAAGMTLCVVGCGSGQTARIIAQEQRV